MDKLGLLAIYPEFESEELYPEIRVDGAISNAMDEISEEKWGIYYVRGVYALAAHFLSLRSIIASAGTQGRADLVSSTMDDGTRMDFMGRGSSQKLAKPLEKTEYGHEYLRLMEIVAYKQPRQTIAY
jgi:hypothetical protein